MAGSRSLSAPRKRRSPKRENRGARRLRKRRIRLGRLTQLIASGTAPLRTARAMLAACALLVFLALANLAYQVARKPAELLFPVSGILAKDPAETWRSYGDLFQRHSTATIGAPLLAALAQAEGSGDPMPHTYWRWQLSWHPFALYRPASSAVGMYQMTDPAFEEVRAYCIQNHVVAGPSDCRLTALYSRVVPSHAIELAAVYLDRHVQRILKAQRAAATPQQKRDLAALVHLCGPGPARGFAEGGFRLSEETRCGDHGAASYLRRVRFLTRTFAHLAGGP